MSTTKDAQMNNIGDRLRLAIEKHPFGVTYTGFATLVDIPYRTLQNYMRNEREPSASALIKMAGPGALNVTWVLTGEGEMYVTDYMKKSTVDKLLVLFMPQIIDYCFSRDGRSLSLSQKKEIISYMWSNNHLGLGDAIDTLIEDYDVHSYEEMFEWLDYFRDTINSVEVAPIKSPR